MISEDANTGDVEEKMEDKNEDTDDWGSGLIVILLLLSYKSVPSWVSLASLCHLWTNFTQKQS